MMHKTFQLLALLLTIGNLYGQQTMQSGVGMSAGINNAGTTFINTQNGASLMLEFTVGEVASNTFTNNHILTQGLLQPFTQNHSPLPVTGLQFLARRLNNSQVQLDWKTQQEIDNRGFGIERRRENESNFVQQGFVASKASGGNSTMPLQYVQLDTNAYTGRTYYRLKQEDLNGRFAYSVVRLVSGETTKTITLKAWPLPAKDFFVSTTGISKDVLQVFDAGGRLVKQINITENEVVGINGLAQGAYFLKLREQKDLVQKVVVQ